MKRALIAIASVGILVTIAGVDAANAQEGPAPNPGWEWYATVGPVRRGDQCVVDVDNNRGYGFLKPCSEPQAAAAPRQHAASRVAHHQHHPHKVVYQ
jgi:hypothetical protein